MIAQQIPQPRRAGRVRLALPDRLGQLPPDVQAYWRDQRADQKWNAPAPGKKLIMRKSESEDNAKSRAGDRGELLALTLPRCNRCAPMSRRGFHQVGSGGADLATA